METIKRTIALRRKKENLKGTMTQEETRLQAAHQWRKWGCYLSDLEQIRFAVRAWGTVREDYSKYGNAWDYFLP